MVHESGAVPGRANLLAARLTANVAVAFAGAAPFFPHPVRTVGMPLSADLESFDRAFAAWFLRSSDRIGKRNDR